MKFSDLTKRAKRAVVFFSANTIARDCFDDVWYEKKYHTGGHAGIGNFQHYMLNWRSLLFDPHPFFSTEWYVHNNDDVDFSSTNPFTHFMKTGWRESRDPHPLFSISYYLSQRPDVLAKNLNPWTHFLQFGDAEHYQAHPLFDPVWFLQRHPEGRDGPLMHYLNIARRDAHALFDDDFFALKYPNIDCECGLVYYLSRRNEKLWPNNWFWEDWYKSTLGNGNSSSTTGLAHYVTKGRSDGFKPNPLFCEEWYLDTYSDVKSSELTPLAHFILYGEDEGRSPHVLFDVEYYTAQMRNFHPNNKSAVTHYLDTGWREGLNPHPLFDTKYYLNTHVDVAAADVNPLVHFLTSGCHENRNPHPFFSPRQYLDMNPDVERAGINPLEHYLRFGNTEGRNPNPIFMTSWYRDQHESFLDGENALAHYARTGRFEERDPSPRFDRDFYLAFNQDVDEAGQDPMAHYIGSGAAEGRKIRAPDRDMESCNVLDIPFEIRKRPSNMSGRDVCVFVTYTPNGRIFDHVLYYIDALKRAGLMVVVVVATDGLRNPLPNTIESLDGLIVRMNHGWDFAAWACALAVFPDIWRARLAILTNDSLYGPVSDHALARILDRVRDSTKDVVTLVESHQQARHTMSFFTGLTRKGLESPAVRAFWSSVQSMRHKDQVIWDYEISALQTWEKAGVEIDILFTDATAASATHALNPTLQKWRELLEAGFPFLKVQLLRDKLPQISEQARLKWRERIADNPILIGHIERHLESHAKPRAAAETCPIPAPRKRFKRSRKLNTYYGATQSTRPTEATDLAIEVPFLYLSGSTSSKPQAQAVKAATRIAVIAHIFYPEMSDEFLMSFVHIPEAADLFITTDSDEKRVELERAFAAYANGCVEVRVFPNIGRDIAPTFVGCRDVFDRYEFFLHVHSKKSPHSGRFANWRAFLLSNLLGSPAIVRSILVALDRPDVGLVFSQHFPGVRNLLNWGYDFDLAKDLLRRAGATLSRDLQLEFPSSSFFWGRSAAVTPLLDLQLEWSDFPAEAGQIDGTIAHAIERSIVYFAEIAGFRWLKVISHEIAARATSVPVHDPAYLEQAIVSVTRPLLGNPLLPIANGRLFPEKTSLSTRKSLSGRPRLNLLVPTLNPKQIFGGISTALRTFKEISDACGDAFDRRIVVVNSPVDLTSMIGLPDYTLVQLSETNEAIGDTVVDLSDNHGGELSIAKGDVFVATAWWTASLAVDVRQAQLRYHGEVKPIVYLIQDYEPGFYPWSDQYGRALSSYDDTDSMIALINSEELATFIMRRSAFKEAAVVRYKPNAKIRAALPALPRERIILIYGRPSVARNCFQTICGALYQWQQADPVASQQWRVISVGEEYLETAAIGVCNLEIRGKLSLDDYAALLGRASVGISLMLSPHPSYPPLEMAHAGLRTITNGYEAKDLTQRSPNIISIASVSVPELAAAIARAVADAEPDIGAIRPFEEIADLPCDLPDYAAFELAKRIREA